MASTIAANVTGITTVSALTQGTMLTASGNNIYFVGTTGTTITGTNIDQNLGAAQSTFTAASPASAITMIVGY